MISWDHTCLFNACCTCSEISCGYLVRFTIANDNSERYGLNIWLWAKTQRKQVHVHGLLWIGLSARIDYVHSAFVFCVGMKYFMFQTVLNFDVPFSTYCWETLPPKICFYIHKSSVAKETIITEGQNVNKSQIQVESRLILLLILSHCYNYHNPQNRKRQGRGKGRQIAFIKLSNVAVDPIIFLKAHEVLKLGRWKPKTQCN